MKCYSYNFISYVVFDENEGLLTKIQSINTACHYVSQDYK